MNDITKARFFLKTNGSDLQHLESFGLMMATAEQRYRDLSMKKMREHEDGFTEREIRAILDYAGLRHLKRHNKLPVNVARAFDPGVDPGERLDMAREWIRV